MKNETILNLQSEADQLLDSAKQELERSVKDVTSHMVCHSARQSLINYLSSFLLLNDVEPKQPVTLAEVMEQCRSIDARFEYLDISTYNCRFETHDRDYCLSVEKVDECFRIANQAKAIVMSNSPSY